MLRLLMQLMTKDMVMGTLMNIMNHLKSRLMILNKVSTTWFKLLEMSTEV